MAFGDLIGTAFTATASSITNPFSSSGGSATVAVGDLVYVVIAEQTDITTTAVTDNLGNTYTACNAGSDTGTPTAISFYSIVTVAGTITAVSGTCTASSHDAALVGAAFTGPFSAIDANPANGTTNIIATPFNCPATGTLAQANEVIIAWLKINAGGHGMTGTSPNIFVAEAVQSSAAGVCLGHQTVSSTSTVTPQFTDDTTAAAAIQGTTSFKKAAAGGGLKGPLIRGGPLTHGSLIRGGRLAA